MKPVLVGALMLLAAGCMDDAGGKNAPTQSTFAEHAAHSNSNLTATMESESPAPIITPAPESCPAELGPAQSQRLEYNWTMTIDGQAKLPFSITDGTEMAWANLTFYYDQLGIAMANVGSDSYEVRLDAPNGSRVILHQGFVAETYSFGTQWTWPMEEPLLRPEPGEWYLRILGRGTVRSVVQIDALVRYCDEAA